MFRKQTFRLYTGSLFFLAICQAANSLFDPPLICNTGIGFGINIPLFVLIPLTSITLIIAGSFVWKILASTSASFPFALPGASILIGGALSNIGERLTRGCIPDYFLLGWFPAFNMADIGVSIGVIFLAISILRNKETGESH